MPTFELTSPQGQKYRVDGPEGATEQDALRQLQRQLAGLPIEQSMSAGDQAADVAKSAGIGVVKGGIGMAGLAGDVGSLASRGIEKARDYLGVSPETAERVKGAALTAAMSNPLTAITAAPAMLAAKYGPTSSAIQGAVEEKTGKFYEPQSRMGRYAETVGEMLPSAIGGAGGVARRVGGAVAGGLASEAAGEAAQGTKFEPYARVAGAVAGGLPFGRWRSTPARPGGPAPIAEELHEAATAQYKAVRDMDLRLKTTPIAGVADTIEQKLTRDGFTRTNVPETYGVIDRLQSLRKAAANAFVSGSDFDAALQELRQATQNRANLREGPAAWKAIEELNQYLKNIPTAHVIQGDAKAASAIFDQARGNWAAMKRLEMLGGKLELGDLNAATAHSGMNRDNAIRQAVKQLIRPNKYGKTLAEQHGFSEREIAAMNEIARGSAPINTLRYIGNLLGGGGGLGTTLLTGAGAVAGYETGHPELAGLGLAGYAARRAAGALTARQARRLMEEVGYRSPEGRSLPVIPGRTSEAGPLLGAAGLRGAAVDKDERKPLRIRVPVYGGPS